MAGEFAIIITGRGEPARRMAFDRHRREVTIGRAPLNDIMLVAGGVSGRHAALLVRDGRFIIADIASSGGVHVNGLRIEGPLAIFDTDVVRIGDYTLELEADVFREDAMVFGAPDSKAPSREPGDVEGSPADPVEGKLLAAVASHDDSARLVYADLLELRGEVDRAEFLRVQQRLVAMSSEDALFLKCTKRLRRLAKSIDPEWRARVARPPIERCRVAFEFQCPKEWGSLTPTGQSDVRFCTACAKQVFYCLTVGDARRRSLRGECVAVDVSNLRSGGDLEPLRLTRGMVSTRFDHPDTDREEG